MNPNYNTSFYTSGNNSNNLQTSGYSFPQQIGTTDQILKVASVGRILEWGTGGGGQDPIVGSDNIAIPNSILPSISATAYDNIFIDGSSATKALIFGDGNIGIGVSALDLITNASHNTAVGYASMNLLNNSGVNADGNSAIGSRTFDSLLDGQYNTAVGYNAGNSAQECISCTYLGAFSDTDDVTGGSNRTALGYLAVSTLNDNITLGNTAVTTVLPGSTGTVSLGNFTYKFKEVVLPNGVVNGSGSELINSTNIAIPTTTLPNITSGTNNVVIDPGNSAKALSTSTHNCYIGSLVGNSSTGNNNIGIGSFALQVNTTGGNNVAIGRASLNAGVTASSNTAIGTNSQLVNTGSGNVSMGNNSCIYTTNATNSVFLGNNTGSLNVLTGAVNITSSTNSFFFGVFAGSTSATPVGQTQIGSYGVCDADNSVSLGKSYLGDTLNIVSGATSGVTDLGSITRKFKSCWLESGLIMKSAVATSRVGQLSCVYTSAVAHTVEAFTTLLTNTSITANTIVYATAVCANTAKTYVVTEKTRSNGVSITFNLASQQINGDATVLINYFMVEPY